MRFLLRPGWITFILFVIGFAVACYTVLAPWQFRRNAERAEQNRQIAASYAHPPAPLEQLVAPDTPPAASVQWRQAVVHGQYLPEREAVVRLRTVRGNPAFEVLTAFRTDDGRTIAIDRGWVRPVAGQQVAPFSSAPTGPVTLIGRIRLDETDPQHRASFVAAGHHQLYAASSQLFGAAVGLPVAPGYLQLVDNQPGGLGVLPLPETDSGPFLSYAWQWLTFGAMALFGLGYFIRLELLHRRTQSEEDDRTQDEATAVAADEPNTTGTETTDTTTDTETTDTELEPSGSGRREPAQGRERVSVRRALASVRADRDALRRALRDAEPAEAAKPSQDLGRAEPPSTRTGGDLNRDRLIERYGKARF